MRVILFILITGFWFVGADDESMQNPVMMGSLNVNDGAEDPSPDTLMINVNNIVFIQRIAFIPGWNMFSVRVNPENPDMKAIFEPLINEELLIKIQDENGNALEDYGIIGGWINNIGNIQVTEGYKIKVNDTCSIEITGTPAGFPLTIPLKAGWNIMGYPPEQEADGKEMVRQLIERGTLVKVQDEAGNAIEDFGILGGWQNFIGNFESGEGYKIKVTTGEILTIEENQHPPLTGKLVSYFGCKDFNGTSMDYAITDALSCVEYTYNPSSSLFSIKHINAGFNCCPEELFCIVTESNDTLIIQECEKDALCHCLCLFDLNIEISGVEAKKYMLKFIEPYCGNQDKIIFSIDLELHQEGSFCVTRKQYPWGTAQ